jgi:hypothetical protein
LSITLKDLTLAEMESLWAGAKEDEGPPEAHSLPQ